MKVEGESQATDTESLRVTCCIIKQTVVKIKSDRGLIIKNSVCHDKKFDFREKSPQEDFFRFLLSCPGE